MHAKVSDIRQEFKRLLDDEKFVIDKTGVKTVEILGASFEADEEGIIREPNLDYVTREVAWYESQSLYVEDIPGDIPKIWESVSSDHGRINSNYGYLIWNRANHDQFHNCVSELVRNPDSRRAIMIYQRPSMHEEYDTDGMSDFICTNAVQYVIRDGHVDCIVQMRSNDAWAGYQNDRAWQLVVLNRVVEDIFARSGKILKVGKICWQVGSLHIYQSQFYCLDYMIKTGKDLCNVTKGEYRKMFPNSKYI